MDYAMITYITYINQVVGSRPSPGLSGLTETQLSLIFPMFDTVRAWGQAAKGCQCGSSSPWIKKHMSKIVKAPSRFSLWSWLTVRHGLSMALIEIDGLPIKNGGLITKGVYTWILLGIKKHWPTQHLHLVWFSIWSHLWPLRFWASDYELMGQDPNQDICVHHCLQLVFSHFLSAGSSYFSGGNQRWFQVLHSFQSSSKCQYSLASSLQSLRKIS